MLMESRWFFLGGRGGGKRFFLVVTGLADRSVCSLTCLSRA